LILAKRYDISDHFQTYEGKRFNLIWLFYIEP
jgi:hypothetical protein